MQGTSEYVNLYNKSNLMVHGQVQVTSEWI